MKGFILLLCLTLSAYTAWHMVPVDARKEFLAWIKPHALRLGVLIFVVVALAYAAYILPSFRFT